MLRNLGEEVFGQVEEAGLPRLGLLVGHELDDVPLGRSPLRVHQARGVPVQHVHPLEGIRADPDDHERERAAAGGHDGVDGRVEVAEGAVREDEQDVVGGGPRLLGGLRGLGCVQDAGEQGLHVGGPGQAGRLQHLLVRRHDLLKPAHLRRRVVAIQREAHVRCREVVDGQFGAESVAGDLLVAVVGRQDGDHGAQDLQVLVGLGPAHEVERAGLEGVPVGAGEVDGHVQVQLQPRLEVVREAHHLVQVRGHLQSAGVLVLASLLPLEVRVYQLQGAGLGAGPVHIDQRPESGSGDSDEVRGAIVVPIEAVDLERRVQVSTAEFVAFKRERDPGGIQCVVLHLCLVYL